MRHRVGDEGNMGNCCFEFEVAESVEVQQPLIKIL